VLHAADLDLARIARALDERFPELAPSAALVVLDHGFNSVVIQTSGAIILRVGRSARSYAGYSLEHRLLPAIAARLPVEVPSPRWLIEPCDDFAGGAVGYPKIEGRTLSLELFRDIDQAALAAAIAGLLVALHGVDLASLPDVPTRVLVSDAQVI
jgi:aminoglycoside phosphotransferase (APT) family kinase protein